MKRVPVLACLLVLAGCGASDAPDVPPLAGDEAVPLPSAVRADRVEAVVADGDGPSDNGPVWFVESSGRSGVRFRPVALRDGKAASQGAGGRIASGPGARYDVARWDPGERDEYFFVMRPRAEGVAVAVHAPGPRAPKVASGFARIATPPDGVTRELAIATWSGERPDLFVLDRGAPGERLQLSIFSGESGFSKALMRIKLPYRGLDVRDWTVDVGRVTQPQPDLVFVARNGTRRSAEVHVLDGEHNFQSFAYDRALDLPAKLPSSYEIAFTVSEATESLLGVDLGREPPVLRLFPLYARPGAL